MKKYTVQDLIDKLLFIDPTFIVHHEWCDCYWLWNWEIEIGNIDSDKCILIKRYND